MNNSINILNDKRDKLKIDLLKQQKYLFEIELHTFTSLYQLHTHHQQDQLERRRTTLAGDGRRGGRGRDEAMTLKR